MAKSLEQKIKDCLVEITKAKSYKIWLSGIKTVAEDDLVILNNSFIYRDVTTVKSPKFLAFSIFSNRKIKEFYVLEGVTINTDFKHISHKQNDFTKTLLTTAIKDEMKILGQLIFILIGVVEDTVQVETDVNSSILKKLVFNPLGSSISIVGDTVIIHDTADEDMIWNHVKKHFQGEVDFDNNEEHIKAEVGRCLDNLESKSYSILKIPRKLKRGQKTVTEALVNMLSTQISDYENALKACKGDPSTDKNSFNELLRIAYNFSSDALTFVRLIVSICDLKPIVLWGTIKAHYDLSEGFKNLPWLRSKRKPSLNNYRRIIGGARNSSFHNLFPFKRSVDIVIPDKSLTGITLRTFSEYSRKKENELKFRDKELVDVLVEFTRTNEHKISPSFWQKNLGILVATRDLFQDTADFLKHVYKETSV